MIRSATDLGTRWAGTLLAGTWDLDVRGEVHVRGVEQAGVAAIFAVWHGQLLAPLWHRRRQGIALLVSAHRDGARLGRAAAQWGYRVVHGSSTRGGARGLHGIVRALRDGHAAAFTPDGPRGPARVAKAGAIAAAQHAGAAIVPVAAGASAAWRLNSWDAFLVPRPYAAVRVVYGAPLSVRPGPDGLAEGLTRLARGLYDAERLAQC